MEGDGTIVNWICFCVLFLSFKFKHANDFITYAPELWWRLGCWLPFDLFYVFLGNFVIKHRYEITFGSSSIFDDRIMPVNEIFIEHLTIV